MPSTQLQTAPAPQTSPFPPRRRCRVAVIWIDWYAYHVARFEGLLRTPELAGAVAGIEMVGGVGVHAGLKFREDLPAGLPVATLMPGKSWSEAGQLRLARELWRALDRLDPEVVLVPGYYTLPALAAAIWARLHGRKSVLMTESTAADHKRVWWKERLKSFAIRALFRWAIAGGTPHVRYLRELGFPIARIARFYDVVDNAGLSGRSAEVRRLSTPEEASLPAQPYFLYVGRLAPEKNVGGLLEAWLGYRASGGTWPLVLVGDGPLAPSLREAAASSAHADAVHFAGHHGSASLPQFYAFAGCFVLPSTREPWGLVVNEAMACGLPVIVSNRCGCVEDLVLNGKNGFTFDPAHDRELEHCLELTASLSQEKLSALGAHSFERIQSFSPENFGAEVARIARS